MATFDSQTTHVYDLRAGTTKLIASAKGGPADLVIAGRFTNVEVTQQLLVYEAFHRRISLFRLKEGALQLVRRNELMTSWDIIVPGNFSGGSRQEVLFFEKATGKVKLARFDDAGEIEVIAEDRFANPWDILVPGDFGGRSETDLLLYDRESGRLKIVRTEGAKLVDTILDTDVGSGWNAIVAAELEHGGHVFDGLFFYNRATGAAQVRKLTLPKHELVLRESLRLRAHADVVLAGRFNRAEAPFGILLYERDTGEADVHGFRPQTGKLEVVAKHALPKHADLLVPIQYTTEMQSCEELLVHGIHNRGLCFGFEGHADTNVDFGEFFDQDHTVMAWFMPQWVHNEAQPVVAENGSGTYMFGLYDYSEGDLVNNHRKEGKDFNKPGSPVLFLRVGTKQVLYSAPMIAVGKWSHLAVIRSGNRFSLFVDGEKQSPVEFVKVRTTVQDEDGNDVQVLERVDLVPVDEIEVPGATFAGKPTGTLRFGRRTSGSDAGVDADDSHWKWQAYGIVDDAAVFLTDSVDGLRKVVASRRLTGAEEKIHACWPFDWAQTVAEKAFRPWTPSTKSRQANGNGPLGPHVARDVIPSWSTISASRSSARDGAVLEDPAVIIHCHDVVHPPFEEGLACRVTQESDAPLVSHLGRHAFSQDLVVHEGSGEYPNGTKNAPVFAVVRGNVVAYLGDVTPAGKEREPNVVKQQFEVDRIASYLHLAPNSLDDAISGGTPNSDGVFEFAEGTGPLLDVGAPVAKVGPNAKHLHFGIRGCVGPYADDRSIPVPCAFRDIEVFDEKTKTWRAPKAVFLRKHDVFRRR